MESGHTILSALLYVSGVFYPTTGQQWEKAVLCISGLGFFVLWTTYMNSTLSYLHGVGVSAHGNSVVAFSLPLPFVFLKVVLENQTQNLACWASPVPQNDFPVLVSLSSDSCSICRSGSDQL